MTPGSKEESAIQHVASERDGTCLLTEAVYVVCHGQQSQWQNSPLGPARIKASTSI